MNPNQILTVQVVECKEENAAVKKTCVNIVLFPFYVFYKIKEF